MGKELDRIEDIEVIAEKAHSSEGVSEHFTGQHTAKQRVSVDFPLSLLQMIDAERETAGISREAWIEKACEERLRQIEDRRQWAERIRQWDQQMAEAYARIPDDVEEVEIWREAQVWGDDWDETIQLNAPAGVQHANKNE